MKIPEFSSEKKEFRLLVLLVLQTKKSKKPVPLPPRRCFVRNDQAEAALHHFWAQTSNVLHHR
jgi:hypothetical protein